MSSYVENIIEVYNECTLTEHVDGIAWYSVAKGQAQTIADKHELPLRIVVGVIAALSPTNKWERNLNDADNMCEVFVSGGYVEDVTVCTYKAMRDKAWSILERMPNYAIDVEPILKGPKITDFFWCILGEADVCVIDGHAWCIANGDRRSMQEVPNIGKKLRQDLQNAYATAAEACGLTAYQMQAITWVTWKRIHNV
jgi:hypothetical protein